MVNDFSSYNVFCVLIAYLLGSIPTAVWVGKRFYGIDIREHGSKNAGATNTFRVLGKRAGIPVLAVDILKGYLAVKLGGYYSEYYANTNPLVNFRIVLGAAAILGHIFPVFANFKGGKGVATLFGVIVAMHWQAALVSIAIFLIVFIISKYVSLGSMVTALLYPFLIVAVFKTDSPSMIYFSITIAILILFTHQKNIERLVRGEESKMLKLKLKRKKH
jgi:glycerol-3-phosphate acyltransferase PlsY